MVLSTWGQGIEAIPSAAHVCLCVYKFSARKFGNEGQKNVPDFSVKCIPPTAVVWYIFSWTCRLG